MTTPKASGPLWAYRYSGDGDTILDTDHVSTMPFDDCTSPCRLIPGHGKVVPMELVVAIKAAFVDGADAVDAAIDAAIKGSL